MKKLRGTRDRVPIFFLVLIFTLICSLHGMAQWLGVNHSATDSNYNVATITAVAVDVSGKFATYTTTPANHLAAGQRVSIALGCSATATPACTYATGVDSTILSRVTGNVIVATVAANGSNFTVNAPGTSIFPVFTQTGLSSGSATMLNADPVTFLPGKTYTGFAHCLTCHQSDYNSTTGKADPSLSKIQNSPFDPNGYLLTGHPNVVRKVAPPGTYPMGGAEEEGYFNPYPDHLVTTLGVDLPIMNWGDTYPAGFLFNWNQGVVTGGGTNYPLTYVTGGWSEEGNPDDVFMLSSHDLSTATMYVATDGTHNTGSSYSCARCHVAGYRFDALGTEPSVANADGSYTKLTDAQLKRVPAGWSASSGQTSSWFETGITCNRCHGNNWCTGAAAKTAPDGTVLNPPAADATGTAQCGWIDASVSPNVVRRSLAYQPRNQQATALCIECHRLDSSDTTAHKVNIAQVPGTFSAPRGSGCSDGSSKTVAECLNAGLVWNLPGVSLRHGSNGAETFLSSPHARWTPNCSKSAYTDQASCTAAGGNWGLVQNAQNSPDQSVQMNGTYSSHFYDWGEGMSAAHNEWNSDLAALATDTKALPTDGPKDGKTYTINGVSVTMGRANGGCAGCHNVHYSLLNPTPPAGWAMTVTPGKAGNDSPDPVGTPLAFARPGGKTCLACHTGTHAITVFKHPTGAGTPFNLDGTGTQDANTACVTCHMASVSTGHASYHFFRINPEASYFTFSAYNVYGCTGTAPNIVCGSAIANTLVSTYDDGTGYQGAGLDVDFACGQCHGGGTSSPQGGWQNPYGLAGPAQKSAAFSRAYLAMAAEGMHGTPRSTSTPAAPTFLPAGGTYGTAQNVFLSSATPGAAIFYTVDGSTPTTSSTPYVPGAPVAVTATTTIKAIAGGAGFNSSAAASATYAIVPIPAVPKFTPGSGIFHGAQSVGLTTSTPNTGTTFYYTTDGSTPTTSSTACSAPCSVSVSASETIKTIAVYTTADGSHTSSVASATYRILPAPAPTFSPNPVPTIYTAATNVTLSETVSGLTICYTTDGTTPVVGATSGTCAVGTAYTGPITLARNTMTHIKAVAGGPGFVSSPLVSAFYVIR